MAYLAVNSNHGIKNELEWAVSMWMFSLKVVNGAV